MKITIRATETEVGILQIIGQMGLASGGYRQDADFCIRKAIDEFILKYAGKTTFDLMQDIERLIYDGLKTPKENNTCPK
jgi:hypothetical protein